MVEHTCIAALDHRFGDGGTLLWPAAVWFMLFKKLRWSWLDQLGVAG
jgi:hypothetical protein